MSMKTVFICLLLCIGAAWAAGLVAAQEPQDWRTDYRRPGTFPSGGDDPSQVEWWVKDFRRPGMVPVRDTDLDRVEWWRVDARRPSEFPRAMTMVQAEIDSDGDGVLDDDDNCPNTPRGAKVDAKGCPMDSDGDGVYDGIDQCPDTPKGVEVDARGCTKVTSEKEAELLDTGSLRLENVFFDTNKATLRPESFPVLDEAGEILVKWPQLKIEVGGHTDSQGEDAYNMDLSRRRAQTVLDYMVKKFPSIQGGQYTVKGYGETVPVADNGNAAGRAQNRRVELRVLNKEVLKR